MTRINLIPPKELHYKHLIAEYRELPRIANIAKKKKKYKKDPGFKPNNTYKLGKGHVLFFVDKAHWLYLRFEQLLTEMHNRGYHTSFTEYPLYKHPLPWRNDWIPSKDEIIINKKRINEKLKVIDKG